MDASSLGTWHRAGYTRRRTAHGGERTPRGVFRFSIGSRRQTPDFAGTGRQRSSARTGAWIRLHPLEADNRGQSVPNVAARSTAAGDPEESWNRRQCDRSRSPTGRSRTMNDRNQPITVTCPRCKNSRTKLMPKLGDYSEYRCPNPDCGTYRISGTMEQLIRNGADPAGSPPRRAAL